LFLAHFLQARDPALALECAAAAIYAVFEATQAAGSRELALIQAQEAIVAPATTFVAEKVR
jgi:pyridoxine kinase